MGRCCERAACCERAVVFVFAGADEEERGSAVRGNGRVDMVILWLMCLDVRGIYLSPLYVARSVALRAYF